MTRARLITPSPGLAKVELREWSQEGACQSVQLEKAVLY